MTRKEYEGAGYVEALPTGEFAILYPTYIDTHLGRIFNPLNDRPLYHRITNIPEFKIAGQAHQNNDLTYEWTHSTAKWNTLGHACGVSPVIYDNNGLLVISDCSVGSQGYRFVDDTNRIWSGDETYNSPFGLYEWTKCQKLYFGQDKNDNLVVYNGAQIIILESSICRFIRVRGNAENFAISCVKINPNKAVIIRASVKEIYDLFNQDETNYQPQIDELNRRVLELEKSDKKQIEDINKLSNALNSLKHEVDELKNISQQNGIKNGSKISLQSSRGRFLRDNWEDSIGYFDRDVAGEGEHYTIFTDDILIPNPDPVDPIEDELKIEGKFFMRNNNIVRIKRFTSFALAHLYEEGNDIRPILEEFHGYNSVRIFAYKANIVDFGIIWEYPDNIAFREFCEVLSEYGIDIELVLITDNDSDKLADAERLIKYLSLNPPNNLTLEAVNEPYIHEKLDPYELQSLLTNSPFIYTSGIYTDNRKFYGQYWNDHSARDNEWWRKGGHELLEAWNGGGPSFPDEPALKIPGIQDEPIRPDQTNFNALDFYTYAASCGLMGAGACFHFTSGRTSRLMNDEERKCANSFLDGLNIYPLDAANGSYNRIIEPNQSEQARTYIMGNHAIRIHQSGLEFPEPGWQSLDDFGICWRKR